jgi:nucleoside-diphosphate-sugar epimerase
MKIVIAGASGFVGSALTRTLLDAGHAVTGLGTSTAHPLESMARFKWHAADTTRAGDWQAVVGDADAVVNLAGRTIFKRWSKAYKAQTDRQPHSHHPQPCQRHDR